MAVINGTTATSPTASSSSVFGSVFLNVDWVNPDGSTKRLSGINLMPKDVKHQSELMRKLLAVLEEHGVEKVNGLAKFECSFNVTSPTTEPEVTETGIQL